MVDYCNSILKKNLLPNCNGQAKGFETLGYIVPRSSIDFDSVTFDTSADAEGSVIKLMPLFDGKKGFKIGQTKDAYNETSTKLEEGTYRQTFTNEVHFAILDSSIDASSAMGALGNGEFVVILEQKSNNNDASKFRIYGFENGLRATSGENTPNGDDGNIWNVVLTETGSVKPAYFLFNADIATTRSQLESMIA